MYVSYSVGKCFDSYAPDQDPQGHRRRHAHRGRSVLVDRSDFHLRDLESRVHLQSDPQPAAVQ